MYFIILAVMAAITLVAAIPIALVIALMSPQEGTRLAPEKISAMRGFTMVIIFIVAALLLLAVVCGVSSL